MSEQSISTHETMTVPLASTERETAKSELVGTVRITWTPHEGIYAEAIAYKIGDNPVVRIPGGDTTDAVANLVKFAARENYTEAVLNEILNDDPAFEGAWLYVQAELQADRSWAQSRSI